MRNKILLRIALVLAVIAVILVASVGTAFAAKPTTFTVPIKQAQFQWRAWAVPFGSWNYSYNNYVTENEYTLTGKVLHFLWTYQPYVNNEEGGSTVYTYDKETGYWIEHEGTVTYQYDRYGNNPVVNYFKGYVNFNGTPSENTFSHGIAYQWVYSYYTPDPALLPYAHWDDKMGAWLVGFSIYYWDESSVTQSYNPSFPDPFPKPAPASDYNPLGL